MEFEPGSQYTIEVRHLHAISWSRRVADEAACLPSVFCDLNPICPFLPSTLGQLQWFLRCRIFVIPVLELPLPGGTIWTKPWNYYNNWRRILWIDILVDLPAPAPSFLLPSAYCTKSADIVHCLDVRQHGHEGYLEHCSPLPVYSLDCTNDRCAAHGFSPTPCWPPKSPFSLYWGLSKWRLRCLAVVLPPPCECDLWWSRSKPLFDGISNILHAMSCLVHRWRHHI
mmetsp:Transcript_20726/g.57532  ORF Transcript_20726/g.57532 Transcript_20726/m.57532 type:complete len:226 (-) Transcript_20726:272-949(-)